MDKKEQFWNKLIESCKEFEKSLSPAYKKQTGSYYTAFQMALPMTADLIEQFRRKYGKDELCNKIFLEPCGGSGNFIFAYLYNISDIGFSKSEIKRIIQNIYYCDSNRKASDFYKQHFSEFCKFFFDITLDDEYFSSHIGGSLLFDVTNKNPSYISLNDVFPNLEKADIIITNPPYKNFKAETKHYESMEDYEHDSEIYSKIRTLSQTHLEYSTDGIINLYKLFTEEILKNYTDKNSFINLLIPSSILSDKSCVDLRKHILKSYKVVSIKIIPEGADIVDAQQSLCAVLIDKSASTNKISIFKDFYHFPKDNSDISLSDIKQFSDDWNIFSLNKDDFSKLKALKSFPKVKDLPYIKNLRGELDITANKNSIVSEQTEYKLLRGRNIGYYRLNDEEIKEYVSPDFVEKTAKKEFIKSKRIICQQIVNKNKIRRVSFAPIAENFVLANSCNFIALDNDSPITLNFLLAIFNSPLINWYFKLSSSNNHINNYEIDEFPIPANSKHIKEIDSLVSEYLEKNDEKLVDKINGLVTESFFLEQAYIKNDIKLEEAIKNGREKKEYLLANHKVLNHTTFKLSDLDIEMIKDVPQGGNWKDIPADVVKKSKRLERIVKNGGRTTLYGRIDYSKPAYTITTFFNRPGNGTYVHPHFNRVVSVREAARIQSFPDDYYFYGNKTELLKQVGNAVPPLLAYQIALKIIEVSKCTKTIDLFCGAGGLTCGFKLAGMKSLLATDIMEAACATLAINSPEIPVLCGDITNSNIKNQIIEIAKNGNAEIICGGPPCQGFSMAGFRANDDPRNQLFRHFVDIVKDVSPKIVVFENVEGLLSYEHGNTYKEILTLFSELGYNCLGRLLNTSDYGVPQKRKRVILICIRKNLPFSPAELFPLPTTESNNSKTTAFQAISDLEDIPCGDEVSYKNEKESDFVKTLQGKIPYSIFINSLAKKNIKQPSLFDF